MFCPDRDWLYNAEFGCNSWCDPIFLNDKLLWKSGIIWWLLKCICLYSYDKRGFLLVWWFMLSMNTLVSMPRGAFWIMLYFLLGDEKVFSGIWWFWLAFPPQFELSDLELKLPRLKRESSTWEVICTLLGLFRQVWRVKYMVLMMA